MKLGVSYMLFDGIELLEHSIRQIRNEVDFLQVVYQEKSWYGLNLPKEDLVELERLKKIGLIDELKLFDSFDVKKEINESTLIECRNHEREKRIIGLKSCYEKGCTHYLSMDVDEFYVTKQFIWAKKEIIKNNYDITRLRFINYVKYPTIHRGVAPDDRSCPFICKIYPNSKMGETFSIKEGVRAIIAEGVKPKIKLFDPIKILMHHMETVRKDVSIKYNSTARTVFDRTRTDELIKNIESINEESEHFNFDKIIFPTIGKVKLYKVENMFNIPYKDWLINKNEVRS